MISIHALLAESDEIVLNVSPSLVNFYPRSPCGERLAGDALADLRKWISIHALLAESDAHRPAKARATARFLSTLSLRRATVLRKVPILGIKYFYPRSPCGERPASQTNLPGKISISIHALLAESDFASAGRLQIVYNFYPRSPCGERRWLRCWQLAARDISIHALLAESDGGFGVGS